MALAEASAVGGAVPSDEKGLSKEQIENAHTNRGITWGLFGTCVGILTFLLLIYYSFGSAGKFNASLFQLSVSVIVVALFFFGFAGAYYFRVILPIRKKGSKVTYLRIADTLFVIGFLFLAAEPPLILVTTGLYYAAGVAVILWFVSIALAYRISREFRMNTEERI
jgi:hypothetical protein